MKISVIVPFYNSEKYVQKSLESIFSQNFSDIEIICVDDGSTDKTTDIIKTYNRRDMRLRLLTYVENKGQAFARNKGIEAAEGDYLYFLDSDDCLIDSDALRKLYDIAVSNNVECVLFDSKVYYESERLRERLGSIEKFTQSLESGIYTGSELFANMMSYKKSSIAIWRQFWSRRYLLNNSIKFQEGNMYEDRCFTMEAFLHLKKAYYLGECLHEYFFHEGSVTNKDLTIDGFNSYIKTTLFSIRLIGDCYINPQMHIALHKHIEFLKRMTNRCAIELVKQGYDVNEVCNADNDDALGSKVLLLWGYLYLERFFSPDEYKRLLKADPIIVYGAGNVSFEVQLLLRRFSLSKYIVSVTKKAVHQTDLYEIDEFVDKSDTAVVIVAAMGDNQREMISHLRERDFRNYFSLCEIHE